VSWRVAEVKENENTSANTMHKTHLDKDLHGTTAEAENQVKGRLLLDVVVGESAAVLRREGRKGEKGRGVRREGGEGTEREKWMDCKLLVYAKEKFEMCFETSHFSPLAYGFFTERNTLSRHTPLSLSQAYTHHHYIFNLHTDP
jgi:hypothetical protein